MKPPSELASHNAPLASQVLLGDYEKHSMSQARAKSEPTVMPRAANLTERIDTLGHIEDGPLPGT